MRPARLCHSNSRSQTGRKLEVIHNEFLAFFPSGRAAMVTHGDERLTLVDLLMITSIDVDPKFRTRRGKDGPKKR